MALIHKATLRPTKLELLAQWLPSQSWYQGKTGAELTRVGGYRFDDPEGEVGIETMLVGDGGEIVYQVPLTYRGAPLEDAEASLVGTTEHSVLGSRWVYDATADPVYAPELARMIFTGAGLADEYVEQDGSLVRREPSMAVVASGAPATDAPAVGAIRRVVEEDPTLIVTDGVELAVIRRLAPIAAPVGAALTGTWPGQPDPLLLAYALPR
ncbi:CG0192-related protein [Micromonospora sp. CPCC 206061]|uniref:CG0192-related protein n=1 Tax=Micromonospora sp. CPCC 206061 TaxID=3122410 RepID=UPI002FF01E8C